MCTCTPYHLDTYEPTFLMRSEPKYVCVVSCISFKQHSDSGVHWRRSQYQYYSLNIGHLVLLLLHLRGNYQLWGSFHVIMTSNGEGSSHDILRYLVVIWR